MSRQDSLVNRKTTMSDGVTRGAALQVTGSAAGGSLLELYRRRARRDGNRREAGVTRGVHRVAVRLRTRDRKSTRLNSSHVAISYAVFCLKQKNRRYGDT